MSFRHCIFDLYGTLVDIRTDEERPALWAEMADWYAAHGAVYSADALKSAYFATVRRMLRGAVPLRQDAHEAHPEIQIEAVFRALFREKGVDAGPALAVETGVHFRRASTDYLRLYPGAAALLAALRESGRRVHLLSNAQQIFTCWELRELGIDGAFDSVYLSSDYGCKKPDPRFFRRLLREQGIPPETAVMVGNDGLCDIQGAKAVGLATVYIRSNISPAEPLPEADFVLPEMDLEKVGRILLRR